MKLARRLPLVAAAAFVFSTCDDLPTDPRASDLPAASILDAAHGGNPHFYFLPPLVKSQQRPAGVANVKLSPTASLCELDGAGVCAGADVMVWQSAQRPGRESIKVTGEKYQLHLRPSDLGLTTSSTYRLTVSAGAEVLGHVDIRLFANGNQRKAIDLTQFAAVSANGATPVHFVIEDGALCSEQAAGCFETTVTNDGGEFVLEEEASDAEAGVEFPEEALPEDPETGEPQQVNLIIERIPLETLPGGRCLPTDLPQLGHCFRFRTEPEVTFTTPVTVGICPAEDAPLPESAKIHRFDEENNTLQALDVVDALFLSCDGPETIGFLPGRAGRLAFAGWEALKSAVLPGEAHARDLGLGGLTQSFSRMSWAQPVAMTLQAGGEQTGIAGTNAAIDPSVLVVTANVQPPEVVAPVEGVEIAFQITHADGSIEDLIGVTDANGIASVPWTFSETPGTETVVATSPEPDAQSVTFTATTTAPSTLVSHYAADGDATDAVGTADLSVFNGTLAFATGISGLAFDFDRFSSYLQIAPHPTMANAPETSASLWVNIDPASPKAATQRFLSLADQFVIRQHGSTTPGNVRDLHFYTRGDITAAVHLPDVLVTGCWNHIAATVSGGVTSLYLNGEQVFTAPASPRPLATHLLLSQSALHEQLDGLIDEVKLFNAGITAADVQELYDEGAASANASEQPLCAESSTAPNLTIAGLTTTGSHTDVNVLAIDVVVSNTGDATAPSSVTMITIDSDETIAIPTPPLAADEAVTLTVSRRFEPDNHFIVAHADVFATVPGGLIPESNEEDNSSTLPITVIAAPVTGAFGKVLDIDDSCCDQEVFASINADTAGVGTFGDAVLRLWVSFGPDWDPTRAQARFEMDTDESGGITSGDYFLTIVPVAGGGYEVNLRESDTGDVVWSRINPAELLVTERGYDFVMPLSDINDSGAMGVLVEIEEHDVVTGGFDGFDRVPGIPTYFDVSFPS